MEYIFFAALNTWSLVGMTDETCDRTCVQNGSWTCEIQEKLRCPLGQESIGVASCHHLLDSALRLKWSLRFSRVILCCVTASRLGAESIGCGESKHIRFLENRMRFWSVKVMFKNCCVFEHSVAINWGLSPSMVTVLVQERYQKPNNSSPEPSGEIEKPGRIFVLKIAEPTVRPT